VLAAVAATPVRVVAADSPESRVDERDVRSIVSNGFIRVAMTRFDLPGFHKRNPDGSIEGIEADLARAIGRELNVKVQINADFGSFDGVADAVAGGRADIGISKLSQTYYRVLHVRFSAPYVTLRHALLYDRPAVAAAANGGPIEEALRAFRGKLGVIDRSAYADFARRNFPNAQIVPLSTWDAAIVALKDGQVQALYRDEFEVRRVLKNDPAINLRIGAGIITDQKAFLSIAICDTCSKLHQFIDYHLREDGRVFTVDQLISMSNQK
jgi:ABC-type amino acid transport substrate-binding protein